MPRFVLVLILTLPSLLTFACGSKSTDKPQLASSASGPAANVPCQDGFERKGQGCVDIDECGGVATPCGPHPEAKCKNTAGAYECTCPAGYVGGGPGGFGCAPSVVGVRFDTCVISQAGSVECWDIKQRKATPHTPDTLASLKGVVSLEAQLGVVCALLRDGSVWCWGKNDEGQLGDGTQAARLEPAQVQGVRSAVALATSGTQTCALLRNGDVTCWGLNSYGALGRMTRERMGLPGPVARIHNAAAIALDVFRGCAVLRDGRAVCWGDGVAGDPGTAPAHLLPHELSGVSNAIAIAVDRAICYLRRDRTVWCKGANSFGQLGNGTRTDSASFVPAKIEGITWMTARMDEMIALKNGQLYRWGRDPNAPTDDSLERTTDASAEAIPVPTRVEGAESIASYTPRMNVRFLDGKVGHGIVGPTVVLQPSRP